MYIVLTDVGGHKRHINLQYIAEFYFDGTNTNIWVHSTGLVAIYGDITAELAKLIRASGSAIKQIGE